MPHALTELNLDAVVKPPAETVHEVSACGMSAPGQCRRKLAETTTC
jgi:hypothetical protein